MEPTHPTSAADAPGEPGTNRYEASRPGKARRVWLWPALVAALLAIHVMVWVGFALVAVNDPSFSVEPDSYKKSLGWDQTAAEMRQSQALGWRAEITTEEAPTVRGERRVLCRLVDRDGNAIADADVDVVTFHHARGSERVEAKFGEESPGTYAAVIRMPKAGLWEYRITARRGQEVFHQVIYNAIEADGGKGAWRR